MLKNKKMLIIILISIMVVMIITIGIILIVNKNNTNNKQEGNVENKVNIEELESNFRNDFYNIEYSQNEENIVIPAYRMQEENQKQYNLNVNLPKINIDTETTKTINNEIINTYATKLLNILKDAQNHTVYNVDYITYTNENILSIIIKCTLKEGSNPQRLIIQTYNYDIENDKQISFEEILSLKNIESSDVQSQIIKTIREKNEKTETVSNQGYNLYVRDIRSDEYLIENIKTYFLGQDGHLYIIFAYGNTSFTETMDIIIV